jgi:predicted RNA-binding Zn ribbon-like protein
VTSAVDFLWIGNHPATDLCNTEPVIDGRKLDLLPDLTSIVRWAESAGIAAGVDVTAFTERDARRTMRVVHGTRQALRNVLESTGSNVAAVDDLNALLAGETGALRVVQSRTDAALTWVAPTVPAQLRLDIVRAAVDIFEQGLAFVRKCANPACVLLFLDSSKSRRRRWCDMSTCGNRAKAARHYARGRLS